MMFTKKMTEEEKLNYSIAFIVRNGKDFLFIEGGLQVLQFLREHHHFCGDVNKSMEAMYQNIVGL